MERRDIGWEAEGCARGCVMGCARGAIDI